MNAVVTLRPDAKAPVVNKHIYGHFAEHLGRCIYEGIWVGEDSPIPNTRGIRNDVVAALKAIDIPNLRWPGGCFADEYHWKDGIGPRDQRPSMINTHWGGVVENNHFGTHEFMDLCEQLGTDAYICGNVGSGTVQEMMEWVEYLTSPAQSPMANLRRKNGREEPWEVPFFGVGNESWGCGGSMRPEFYADEYRRYNTFVKNYTNKRIYRIACGANSGDVNWTNVLMERAGRNMNGLSLHNYTLLDQRWPPSGSATQFDEREWFSILKAARAIDNQIQRHSEVMDRHDPQKRVGMIVDEWGTWYPVEPGTNPGFLYQQNTMRDALVAAIHFEVFHKHASRVTMANIAQTINVLQAMILTDKERMLRTPTYWVFEMYKHHQDGQFVPMEVATPDYVFGEEKMPALSATATIRSDKKHLDVSMANLDPHKPLNLKVNLPGTSMMLAARILTGDRMQAHNTFDQPDLVMPKEFPGARLSGSSLELTLPPMSVVCVHLGLA